MEILMLHVQFAALGFIAASGFRLLGLRKQLRDHDDNAV